MLLHAGVGFLGVTGPRFLGLSSWMEATRVMEESGEAEICGPATLPAHLACLDLPQEATVSAQLFLTLLTILLTLLLTVLLKLLTVLLTLLARDAGSPPEATSVPGLWWQLSCYWPGRMAARYSRWQSTSHQRTAIYSYSHHCSCSCS